MQNLFHDLPLGSTSDKKFCSITFRSHILHAGVLIRVQKIWPDSFFHSLSKKVPCSTPSSSPNCGADPGEKLNWFVLASTECQQVEEGCQENEL